MSNKLHTSCWLLCTLLCTLFLLNGLSVNQVAMATELTEQSNPTIRVILNGQRVDFDSQPIIKEDRTLVPMRAIFETLGMDIGWDSENKIATATKDNITLTIQIDNMVMYKNEQAIQLDVAACIIQDRTLIPLRAISESIGAIVEYDSFTRNVLIGTDGYDLSLLPRLDTSYSNYLCLSPMEVEELLGAIIARNGEGMYTFYAFEKTGENIWFEFDGSRQNAEGEWVPIGQSACISIHAELQYFLKGTMPTKISTEVAEWYLGDCTRNPDSFISVLGAIEQKVESEKYRIIVECQEDEKIFDTSQCYFYVDFP